MLAKFDNIFLDRDGIINEVVIRDKVISSPRTIDEFVFKPDVIEFIRALQRLKKNIFVVSNQPDIARGKLKEKDLTLMTKLIKQKLNITEISYCMHDDRDNCNCRKPLPGLIINYIKKYKLLKSKSVIIGDSYKDVEAGLNAGINSLLLATNYNKDIQIKYKKNTKVCLFRDFNELECVLGS